jgi:hypothetical protein
VDMQERAWDKEDSVQKKLRMKKQLIHQNRAAEQSVQGFTAASYKLLGSFWSKIESFQRRCFNDKWLVISADCSP